MNYSIIAIGNELLLGQVTDTNSARIARILDPLGWKHLRTVVVPDSGSDIAAAISAAASDSDLVITTGGLGATKDDITKTVIARLCGCGMRTDAIALANAKRVFEVRGLQFNQCTATQAIVPEASTILQNQFGTAPIMWTPVGGAVVVSLPGVPFEAIGMMEGPVKDAILAHFQPMRRMLHRTLIVTGKPESAFSEMLEPFEAALPPSMTLAYLPQPGLVRLRLDADVPAEDDGAAFEAQVEALKEAVKPYLLYDGDAPLAQIVLERLRALSLTMATAESCTGGNIAHQITLIPGSSDCFAGGIVSYANEVKINLLRVSPDDLASEGAVSRPVVEAMAVGAAKACRARCAVATSGIAGPGGATPGKPVGTVWIAAQGPDGKVASRLLHLPGDRSRVIERATTEALLLLLSLLPNP